MTDAVSAKVDSCQNCGEPLSGDFCGNCGQRDKESRRAFILLLQETLYTVFELDGRAYKTLWYLFDKPAFLSTEYTKGRRASYTPPLRLFLVISIGFFLLVAFITSFQSMRNTVIGVNPTGTVTADFNLSFSDGIVEILTASRFYVEHFILTLHNHAFLVFSIFLLWVVGIIEELEITLLSAGFGWIGTAVGFWIVIYLYLSLKRFFGEGYFVTTLKFVTVSLIYSVCVGVGIMLFFFLLFIFS